MQPLRLPADLAMLSAGGPCMSDADRTTFLTELIDANNATASFILNGAQGKMYIATNIICYHSPCHAFQFVHD